MLDTALLAVLYAAGLRRAEAVALDVEHDDNVQSGGLRVLGKGNKERLAYVTLGGQLAPDEWLELRGDEPGPLFWPTHRWGKVLPQRVTGRVVLYTRRRAAAAAVRTFFPHDLPRTFVGDLLEAGADPSNVQQLAGHAQVQTTAGYDRRGEGASGRPPRSCMSLITVGADSVIAGTVRVVWDQRRETPRW